MDQDISVNDLQGYRCWSVGWGKTTQDGSGDYSTQVSAILYCSYQTDQYDSYVFLLYITAIQFSAFFTALRLLL